MPKEAWEKYGKHGIFAALFITLLLYTMNENKARESDYKQIIRDQAEANSKFADLIKIDLNELKAKMKP